MTDDETSENEKKFPKKYITAGDISGQSSDYIFEYDSIWTNANIVNPTFEFNPEIFNHPPERVLNLLLGIIQNHVSTKEYQMFFETIMNTYEKETFILWIEKAKIWHVENIQEIEKARLLEKELLKKELENAIPKSVRDVIKYSRQNDHVIVKGEISQRSLPVLATRMDTEYTGYNLTLVDLDDSTYRIPVKNLPADDYDNGYIITISGIKTQTVRRGKAFIEIDGLDFRIEERKSIPSDPLERVCRPLVYDFYESKYPEYIAWSDALGEISDKNQEASKVMDPHNRRKFTTEEAIPKRLNKISCERRASDRGYLERGPKRSPLNYRWVKKGEDEDKA